MQEDLEVDIEDEVLDIESEDVRENVEIPEEELLLGDPKLVRERIGYLLYEAMTGPLSFYGAFIGLCDIKYDNTFPACAAMGFSLESGNPVLWLNPVKIAQYKLTDTHIMFVLIHEVLHLIFLHPWHYWASTFYQKDKLNYAMDRVINSNIVEDHYATQDADFTNSKNLDIKAIREGKIEDFEVQKLIPVSTDPKDLVGILMGIARDNIKYEPPGLLLTPPYSRLPLFYRKPNQSNASHSVHEVYLEEVEVDGDGEGEHGDGNATGSHDFWDQFSSNMDEEQAKRMVSDMVSRASQLAIGSTPQRVLDWVNGFSAPKINWRRMIRNFAARHVTINKETTWSKSHNIYPNDIPGSRFIETMSIGFVIDVSGSVDEKSFISFYNEMIHLSKLYTCTQLQIDTEACSDRMEPIDGKKIMQTGVARKGMGGTDMNPGLKIAMSDRSVDMVILFTDGWVPPIDSSLLKKPLYIVVCKGGSTDIPFTGHRKRVGIIGIE